MPRNPPPKKALAFHLRGNPTGPHLIRAEPDDTCSAAHALWALTKMGTIGREFEWFGTDGMAYSYHVVDKTEAHDVITVVCERVDLSEQTGDGND